jgi:hypothetical protein
VPRRRKHEAYLFCDTCGNDVPAIPRLSHVHESVYRIEPDKLETFRAEMRGVTCAACGSYMIVTIDGRVEPRARDDVTRWEQSPPSLD